MGGAGPCVPSIPAVPPAPLCSSHPRESGLGDKTLGPQSGRWLPKAQSRRSWNCGSGQILDLKSIPGSLQGGGIWWVQLLVPSTCTSVYTSPLHPMPRVSHPPACPSSPPCWAAWRRLSCPKPSLCGVPVTHCAFDRPEGEEVLGPVATVPAPGLPPGIVTLLQDKLLSLVLRVLEAYPAGGKRGKTLRDV